MPVAKLLGRPRHLQPGSITYNRTLSSCKLVMLTLPRQAVSDTLKLTFSDLHAAKNACNIEKSISVTDPRAFLQTLWPPPKHGY
jgi:hypothetical protein